MDRKSFLGNLSAAFLAQGVAFILSIVMSLLVPKALGVEEYGYWQLFILYASYVGFFHLGINDGVYLIHGGERRTDLDKGRISAQLRVSFAMQMVMALAICLSAMLLEDNERRVFVITATACYMLISNASTFLGYVFQAVNETKLYSYSVIIDKAVFLASLLVLVFSEIGSFEVYVVVYGIAKTCALLFCFWMGKDIVFSKGPTVLESLHETWESLCVGIKLMISNIASQLIIGVLRFAVDFAYDIETFGQISFALAMVNFFLNFIMQASMVLFPALRGIGRDGLALLFVRMSQSLALILPGVYLLYAPMVFFLETWLPRYSASFLYFAFLIPICIFDGKMNLVGTTFMKVTRDELELLKINIVAVFLAAMGVLVSIFVFDSVSIALVSMVLVIAGRSLYGEYYVARELKCEFARKEALGEMFLTIAFAFSCVALDGVCSFLAYGAVYAIYLFASRKALSDTLRLVAGSSKRR